MSKILRSADGQSLSEYAVIGALVVAVAVPALMLLGDGANHMFNTSTGKLGDDPMALILGKEAKYIPPPAPPEVTAGDGWEVKYDPNTGEIIYSMPQSGGGGTNTASVSGMTESVEITKSLAQKIAELAAEKDKAGNALPQEIQDQLNLLAQHAYRMSDAELKYTDLVLASPPAEGESLNLGPMQELVDPDHWFTQEFERLEVMLADPLYAELKKEVSGYSGLISEISAQNFLAYTTSQGETHRSVGTTPTYVPPVEESAAVTGQNAGAIGGTALPPGT